MGVSYENGNIHTPVIVLGDDPSNEDNVLVVRLGTGVSVPRNTVSDSEGTSEDEPGTVAIPSAPAPAETSEDTSEDDDKENDEGN